MSKSDELDLLRKIEEELRRKYGTGSLEELLKKLRGENDANERQKVSLMRSKSMCELYRSPKEEDERETRTEPLDKKERERYENMPNPF